MEVTRKGLAHQPAFFFYKYENKIGINLLGRTGENNFAMC
jgi:hypothetical protein